MTDFRGLTQPNRLRLLRAIQRAPGRDVRTLAQECQLPLNTARDHLRVLADEGLIRVETGAARGRGRPPRLFHPCDDGTGSDAVRERISGARRRGALLRGFGGDPSARPEAIDESAQAQLDVLYEHLDDAGLEPDPDAATLTVDVAPCRYHELIDADQALVCSVHARLVTDVLRQVDGPLALQRLQPFVTTHRCRIVLARNGD